MKTKKIINQLVLSKQTVANLENEAMKAIQGGTDTFECQEDARRLSGTFGNACCLHK